MKKYFWGSTIQPIGKLAVLALIISKSAFALTDSYDVNNVTDWTDAFAAAYAYSQSNSGTFTINLLADIAPTSQVVVNANVVVAGNFNTINMGGSDRAFFIAGGNVTMSNLVVESGRAAGGNGADGGGGGAGLGGAIFIGSGTYYGGADPAGVTSIAAQGISTPSVVLSNVSFQTNQAVGGNSLGNPAGGGGGGGMGGNGGNGADATAGGGGGGFGVGAAGGEGSSDDDDDGGAGSNGAFINVNPTGTAGGPGGDGADGSNGGAGGLNGGGGGGGGAVGFTYPGTGGGGGAGGSGGRFDNGSAPTDGGNGGFGGGGGGAAYIASGGAGGFGGGGGAAGNQDGASVTANGGAGGFGGGGGGSTTGDPGAGGFAAGDGSDSNGGGGAGLGGAIFVSGGAILEIQDGSFSNNSANPGTGAGNGSAYGADLFSGSDVTFNVSTGNTVNVTNLGGAGNLNDPTVANNAAVYASQVNGGIIKTGAGTLTVSGANNFYSGNTTVHQGTLALASGASEVGTTQVTVGQNNGDIATFALGSGSNLGLAGFNGTTGGTDLPVVIAQNAGSIGSVVIGNGAGSSGAYIAAKTFTGGSGSASVVFNQEFAVGSTSNSTYPFYTTITGSTKVTQSGPGTTVLNPQYGANSFTGPITVNSGTLRAGSAAALPSGNDITLNGGTLDLDGNSASAGTLTLNGGTLYNQFVAPIHLGSGGNGEFGDGILQTVTIQADGTYLVTVAGAQGGGASSFGVMNGLIGGAGGVVTSTMTLSAGTSFTAIVGQGGISGTVAEMPRNEGHWLYAPVAGGGGGGGSFLFAGATTTETTLLMAGGGGGGAGVQNGAPGGMTLGGNGSGGAGGTYADLAAQGGGGGGGISSSGQQGIGELDNDGGEGGSTILLGPIPIATGGAGELTYSPFEFGILQGGTGGYGAGGGGGTGMIGNDAIDTYIAPTYGGGGGGGGYTGGAGGAADLYDSNNNLINNFPAQGGTSFVSASLASPTSTAGANGTATGQSFQGTDGYVQFTYINPILTVTNIVAYSGTIAAEIAGTGGLTQQGAGTTTISASTRFTGETLITQGTLVANVTDALAGTSGIQISGGTLLLGTSNSINNAASLNLAGGKLQIGLNNLTEGLGAWQISANSLLDFNGNVATLTFTSLQINGNLAIWNWNPASDKLTINGSVSGNLSQVAFYSDNGNTFLGYGAMSGANLVVAVPEPSVLALLGLAGCWLGFRRRARSRAD